MKNQILILLCLTGAAISQCGAVETNTHESARIRWATVELEDAQRSLTSTTNAVERILCERRIDLARKAIENYNLQANLNKKEKVLLQARRSSTDFMLRKAISAIETDEIAPKRAISSRNADVRKLKERRTAEEDRHACLVSSANISMADQANSEALVVNIDTEIMAHMLARDTEEVKIRLAREALRVDAIFSAVEQDHRMTLGLLIDSRRAIKHNRESQQECTAIQSDLNSALDDTYSAIEISQLRVSQLKKEVDILTNRSRVEKQHSVGENGEIQERRGIFSKLFGAGTKAERQLEQMIKDAEGETDLLEKKIGHLKNQSRFLRNSLDLSELGHDLFRAEGDYLTHQYTLQKARYMRRILMPIGAIVIVTLLYLLMSHLLFPAILRQDNIFVARRLGSYSAILIVFFVLVTFFLEDLKAIATIMGIVGAAVVIALQDMCSAFAGWFVIIASRKLRVGDRVEINGNCGEIIDIQMLRTTLVEINNWLGVDEATGRTLIIPNSFIFKSDVFNYSHIHPHIWGKVDITITFESSSQKAYEIFFKVLEEETRDAYAAAAKGGALMAKHYGVSRGIYEPHIHTVIADSGICYSLFYVAHYHHFTLMRDAIMTRIIDVVNETPEVEFAYPTERHIPTPLPLVLPTPPST